MHCSKSGPSQRERVLAFVRLIQSDSLPDILPYIDLDSVATYEYAGAKFASLTLKDKKDRLMRGFLREGEYRAVWSKSQIVVNEETYLDDTTAAVEVSYIDRSTRIQYYSPMTLKRRGGTWIISNFQVTKSL